MTEQRTIRVMIVEDHGVVLWGLKSLVESADPAMCVVGSARNRHEAFKTARAMRPDVILLDVGLGEDNGLDFLPHLMEASGGRVLVLTGVRDEEVHRHAIHRGASGVVCKDEPADVVLKAIRKVYEGEVWFDRKTAFEVLGELMRGAGSPSADGTAPRVASLTPKEREIITIIATEESSTNKQVATRLRISENTLRNHLSSIYDKLGVGNRLELLKFALNHGLT
ncbi:MAG TPA: response regulator transcription factor [Pyrinomonadaceae bacterium]